jgi:hypothetical protein
MSNNPLTREFERKLLKLQRLADLVEDSLVEHAAQLDARLSAEAERYPEPDRQEFFEFHAEDYYELADELPTLLRYAVLTGADTGFEVYLNDTCATYAEVHKATIGVTDLRGTGIERARDYLKKVAQIPFPDVNPEWTSVKRLHQLRNSIVHADGYIPPDGNDIRKWAPSIGGLQITPSGVISLTRDFTGSAIDAYHAFALQVDKACEQLALWRSVFPPLEEA